MAKYYYNDVLLPEVPADEIAACPYYFIQGSTELWAVMCDCPFYFNGTNVTTTKQSGTGKFRQYQLVNGDWVIAATSDNRNMPASFGVSGEWSILFSSHDIPNGSATATEIYFYGSEPVAEDSEDTGDTEAPKTYYRISGERLTGYADQARRLGGVTGELTPAQIEEALAGVGVGKPTFETSLTDKIANHAISYFATVQTSLEEVEEV